VWTQQARIRPANTANVFTGSSVSLFQDDAAFGAPGANRVYVYHRNGTTWSQVDAVNQGSDNSFGSSVAIEGTPISVLVASEFLANAAAGRTFEYGSTGSAYSLLNELVPTPAPAAGEIFGSSVAFNAGRALVGSSGGNGNTGEAYVFKLRSESTTGITGIVNPLDLMTDSLTGVPYTVYVSVLDPAVSNTPQGSVHIDDGNGGSCDASLSEDQLGLASGSCDLTSSFFGQLTITASFGGDLNLAPSSDSKLHKVTGNHFVFDPNAQTNVVEGETGTGVVVKLLNGADALIDDSTTQVTVSVQDTCGNPNTVGTLTLTNGVADFSGIGPKFYTTTTNGALNYTAQESPFSPSTSPSSATSGNFDVDANADILFADGFEDCRL
jgi:hypothetical protein